MDTGQLAQLVFAHLQRLHRTELMQSFRELGSGELAVLSYLCYERDGATAGELSAAFGVGTSRITAVLHSLEKKGLARRQSDLHDGRRVLVCLCPEGRALAEERHRETLGNTRRFLETLEEADAAALLRILQKAAQQSAAGGHNGKSA